MKRFYKDERGSSLVLTIIAMAFISLLAVAVISMTVTNIRLKLAQKGSQKNFYTADSIVDEIRAGVEDLVSSASVDAYMEAFSSYGTVLSGSQEVLSEKYNKKFLETMITKLSGGKSSYGNSTLYYKDEVLQSYLIKNGANPDRYVIHSLHPGGDTKSYGSMVMENDTLLLKDIEVTMTEANKSYKTTITTDIRVNIPEMSAETRSEYLNYALIADNQVVAGVGGAVNVEGSIYAGTVRRYTASASDETGILVENGTTLKLNAEQVVTRGDVFVSGGSTMELNGYNGLPANLWVENIFTSSKGGGGNTLTITGTCNVSDDMEVGGEGDQVTLSGNYYGYNYNNDYTDAGVKTVSTESQYSSAILINGKGSNLNLTGLERLVLSGRTFISKKTNTGEVDERIPTGPSATQAPIMNADIAMGESLSVKGAQVAYYVPNDFVTTKTAANITYPVADTAAGTIRYRYATDLTTEYVFDYKGYMKYLFGLDPKTASDADLTAKAGSFNILSYLDQGAPLTTYYRNDKTVQTNSVTYYYLNFMDETKMMEFYPWFENTAPRYSAVKDVNAAYMGATGISVNDGMQVYCRAGNILYRDASSGDVTTKISNESATIQSSVLHDYARVKSREYMSRQLALSQDYEKASEAIKNGQYRLLNSSSANLSKAGTVDDTNLFNVLINTADLPASTVEQVSASGNGVIIIEPDASATYTWNSSKQTALGGKNKGIIIAAGDVEIEKDFSGLIIAGGDIKLSASGIKVSSDSELLEEMFTEDKKLATPLFFNLFSQYFRRAVNSAIGQDKDAGADTVIYEKWKKE
ncbi:MAG: pilus assembly PilX N-terminal domain-containing protein [Eubacteriales bacterium]|nr:pilus assembly PilX N-terminal domain-containing protein [Eubacteriales bacterium]